MRTNLDRLLAFIVTIKDPEIVNRPTVYQRLVQRCVGSLLQQTDGRLLVALVGRMLPAGLPLSDTRLHHVETTLPVPSPRRFDMNVNKTEKLLAGIRYVGSHSPDYCMLVDSDDCIHRGLAGFVLGQPGRPVGWYARQGLVYREGSRLCWHNRRDFHSMCGSSAIVRTDKIASLFQRYHETGKPYYNLRSHELPCGEALAPVPFPAVVYSVMNGDNIFMTPREVSDLKGRENFFQYYFRKAMTYAPRWRSGRLIDEFGLTSIGHIDGHRPLPKSRL